MKKMKAWVMVVIAVAVVIVILAGAIAIKTATFTSKQIAVDKKVSYPVDLDGAAGRLSGALKFQTVSSIDSSEVDYTQLAGLQGYIDKSFPLVNSTLEKKVINNYGLAICLERQRQPEEAYPSAGAPGRGARPARRLEAPTFLGRYSRRVHLGPRGDR